MRKHCFYKGEDPTKVLAAEVTNHNYNQKWFFDIKRCKCYRLAAKETGVTHAVYITAEEPKHPPG